MRGGNLGPLRNTSVVGVDMGLRVRDRVREWDEDAFQKLTRALQLSLVDGNLERAHAQVDAFANKLKAGVKQVLELGDSVAQLLDPETAGILQGAGYQNISSLVHATDGELLSIYLFGERRLTKVREALIAHGFLSPKRKTPVLTPC